MRKFAFAVGIFLLVLTNVTAQDSAPVDSQQPDPVLAVYGLCDHQFAGFIISVPCEWLTWKQEDQISPALGVVSYIDLLQDADPRISFTTTPDLDSLQFFSLSPDLIDDQIALTRVNTVAYSQINTGTSNEDFLFWVLQTLEFEPITGATINGRPAIIGITPWLSDQGEPRINMIALELFVDQDLMTMVLFASSPGYAVENQDMISVMLTSLRLFGENFDSTAYAVDPETGDN